MKKHLSDENEINHKCKPLIFDGKLTPETIGQNTIKYVYTG